MLLAKLTRQIEPAQARIPSETNAEITPAWDRFATPDQVPGAAAQNLFAFKGPALDTVVESQASCESVAVATGDPLDSPLHRRQP